MIFCCFCTLGFIKKKKIVQGGGGGATGEIWILSGSMIVKYVTRFTHSVGGQSMFGCVCVQCFIYSSEFDGRGELESLVLTWRWCIATNS